MGWDGLAVGLELGPLGTLVGGTGVLVGSGVRISEGVDVG